MSRAPWTTLALVLRFSENAYGPDTKTPQRKGSRVQEIIASRNPRKSPNLVLGMSVSYYSQNYNKAATDYYE